MNILLILKNSYTFFVLNLMSKIWLIMGLFSLNEVYLSSYIYFSFFEKRKTYSWIIFDENCLFEGQIYAFIKTCLLLRIYELSLAYIIGQWSKYLNSWYKKYWFRLLIMIFFYLRWVMCILNIELIVLVKFFIKISFNEYFRRSYIFSLIW